MKVIAKQEFIKKTLQFHGGAKVDFESMSKKFDCGCGSKHKITTVLVINYLRKDLVVMCPDLKCINYVKWKLFGTETIFVSDKM